MNISDVINDPNFPLAIDPVFIAREDSDGDKVVRALAILDLWFKEPVSGKKILDFGCGSGHLIEEICKRGGNGFGYDIAPIPKREKGTFTNSWQDIINNAPYDCAILYDVLDHVEGEHPADALDKLRKVVMSNSLIKTRCHPWCSRHGAHLFHKANKAYLHLLFPQEQLDQAGITGPKTLKVIHPLATYQGWFGRGGYGVMEKKVYRREFEPMFMYEPYRSNIVSHWRHSDLDASLRDGTGFPGYAIEQEFIDYTLKAFP